jgi:hypothetical protein
MDQVNFLFVTLNRCRGVVVYPVRCVECSWILIVWIPASIVTSVHTHTHADLPTELYATHQLSSMHPCIRNQTLQCSLLITTSLCTKLAYIHNIDTSLLYPRLLRCHTKRSTLHKIDNVKNNLLSGPCSKK